MSHADAVRFLDAVETDEAFAQQLEALRDTPDQALDAVRARGFDVDPDEVREAFVERYGADLTEEQLAAIAGGLSAESFYATFSSVFFSVMRTSTALI